MVKKKLSTLEQRDMVIIIVEPQESLSEQDTSAVKRSLNFQHNTGPAKNSGQDQRVQKHLALQAENASTVKDNTHEKEY